MVLRLEPAKKFMVCRERFYKRLPLHPTTLAPADLWRYRWMLHLVDQLQWDVQPLGPFSPKMMTARGTPRAKKRRPALSLLRVRTTSSLATVRIARTSSVTLTRYVP